MSLQQAAKELGDPHLQLTCLHIAGTNGKGSVCNKIARALQISKICCGLFTSPHLEDFKERICLNGKSISSMDIVAGINDLIARLSSRSLDNLNFFDLTFLLALIYFQKNNVKCAVLEAGIGGRLDATTICRPICCAITSIGLDHQEILGSSRFEIASEKAGIIKQGIPIVLGPEAVGLGIEQIAASKQAPITKVEDEELNFDEINSAVALATLTIIKKKFGLQEVEIAQGISYRPPCRFEVIDLNFSAKTKCIVIDAAHNELGFIHLVKMMEKKSFKRPLCIVFGLGRAKNLLSCLKVLKHLQPDSLCPRQLPQITSYNCDEIANIAAELKVPLLDFKSDAMSLRKLVDKFHTLLICGSFYLAAQLRGEIKKLK